MAVTNVVIQKRRMNELSTFLQNYKQEFENIAPYPINSYRQFTFFIDELSPEFLKALEKNGFKMSWIKPRSNKLLVSVFREVTPEKAREYQKEWIARGYKLRDEIDKQSSDYFCNKYFLECCKLEKEVEALKKIIATTDEEMFRLMIENYDLTIANLSIFGLFFNRLEMGL